MHRIQTTIGERHMEKKGSGGAETLNVDDTISLRETDSLVVENGPDTFAFTEFEAAGDQHAYADAGDVIQDQYAAASESHVSAFEPTYDYSSEAPIL